MKIILMKFFSLLKWFTWPEIFNDWNDGFGEFLIRFIFYLFWASLFALLAVLLVRVFAPYASGSGIPEVRVLVRLLTCSLITL